ncbi:MAG: aldo/keto reductase [Tabrizicola sp.]|jgi:D-threo-aldose 1-dehydrogenase|nr:aldo/keto reductase [Tabrizicola sp.]
MLARRHWDRRGTGGVSFTELGFGAAPLGNLFKAISEDEAQAVLEAAWAAGVRYYDTAPLYGMGLSETRMNHFLRGKPRGEYVLSTKVGRLLSAAPPGQGDGAGKWLDVPSRRESFDYSHDGVLRSLEASLERLGLDRVDLLYVHDLDVFTHGSEAAKQARLEEFMAGGYRALCRLRDEGVISGFGAGVNEWEPCDWLLDRGEFDVFLLAGRFTLLEQGALGFMDKAAQRGVGVVIGGPYNSGILATGPRPGAHYNYAPAPQDVLDRAARLQALGERYGVRLVDAAFRFPLLHPATVSVIPGGQGRSEMDSNIRAAGSAIPQALWQALADAGLIPRRLVPPA